MPLFFPLLLPSRFSVSRQISVNWIWCTWRHSVCCLLFTLLRTAWASLVCGIVYFLRKTVCHYLFLTFSPFSFWDSSNTQIRLFFILSTAVGYSSLVFPHSFFSSLYFSVGNFYWVAFKYTDSSLICVKSTGNWQACQRHSASLLPCFSFLYFY